MGGRRTRLTCSQSAGRPFLKHQEASMSDPRKPEETPPKPPPAAPEPPVYGGEWGDTGQPKTPGTPPPDRPGRIKTPPK